MDNSSFYTPAFLERFWSKIDKNGPVPEYRPDFGPCWIWIAAARNVGGYGVISAGSKIDGSRKLLLAHRVSHEIHIGPIPPKYHVDHLCRVRLCVNPAHLEAVTHRENVQRGISGEVNRQRKINQTHCIHGHEYTPENTYIKPGSGARSCRKCRQLERQDRRGYRPMALARIYTPDGRQDVAATHFKVVAGVLSVRLRSELVAVFAPGQWLAVVKERRGIPAPETLALVGEEHYPVMPAA